MSEEIYIGGNYTEYVGGNKKVFAKGNIENYSETEIITTATNGITHGEPKKVDPNDRPFNFIDVSLNIFFDGTQNNKTNTEARQQQKSEYDEMSNKKDDSYENDFSNVARAYDAIDPTAERQFSIYVEGIGTENLKEDNVLKGVGLGLGKTGVKAKVTKACSEAAKSLKSKYGKNNKIYIRRLKVNVYGFSRGATAARHFLSIATQPAETLKFPENVGIAFGPYNVTETEVQVDLESSLLKYGYFGACLSKIGINIDQIIFNFTGLYDTVASYGADHRGKKFLTMNIIDNDTQQLGLDAVQKSNFVVQLSSKDEYRDNFDLTNIKSAGVKGLEFTLPGVHSDIGGAYIDNSKEVTVLYCEEEPKAHINYDYNSRLEYLEKEFNKIRSECEKFKAILIEEGWYKEEELEIKKFTQKEVGNDNFVDKLMVGSDFVGLVGTRERVRSTYDKIPLNIMFHYSKIFDVKYNEIRIEREHNFYDDPLLVKVYENLVNYTNVCHTLLENYYKTPEKSAEYLENLNKISYLDFFEDKEVLKKLRNEYLHWSVKTNKFGLNIKGQDENPHVKGALSEKFRKRNIQDG